MGAKGAAGQVYFLGPDALPAMASGLPVLCADDCSLTAPTGWITEFPGGEHSSRSLMANSAVRTRLQVDAAGVVVWKSSVAVERAAFALSLTLGNSSAALSRRLENKAHFSQAARAAGLPVPEAVTGRAGPELAAAARQLGLPLVFQLAHGFSGAQTYLVSSELELTHVTQRFASHLCRISKLVEGIPVTVTGVAGQHEVVCGPPCLQLTGIPELTPHPLGSCGNDFAAEVPEAERVATTAHRVGEWLRQQGHRGVFGVDLVVSSQGFCWCIEVNPRLVASVPLWSLSARDRGASSLLQQHLAAFGLAPHGADPLTCHWSQLILYRGDWPLAVSRPRTGCGRITPAGVFERTGDLDIHGPALGQMGLVVRGSQRPGGELARLLLEGPLLGADGALLPHLLEAVSVIRTSLEARP